MKTKQHNNLIAKEFYKRMMAKSGQAMALLTALCIHHMTHKVCYMGDKTEWGGHRTGCSFDPPMQNTISKVKGTLGCVFARVGCLKLVSDIRPVGTNTLKQANSRRINSTCTCQIVPNQSPYEYK